MERLTPCELATMQLVWKYKEDIPEIELRQQLSELLKKNYARTTVTTFLKRLEEKRYLEKHRVGRNSYVHALISAKSYGREQLKVVFDMYYDGDKEALLEDVRAI